MLYCSETIQMTPFQYKMALLKILFRSFFTSYDKKSKYLEQVTLDSRKIAIERGLRFTFFTMLSNRHGSSFWVIAQINTNKSRLNRAIDMWFFSHLVMAPEHYVKVTIFHEYCHFLIKYAPKSIVDEIEKLHNARKFPHLHDKLEEDFSDLFGYYIVDKDTGNREINLFLDEFIRITDQNIAKENWIWKASEMPETYLDPYVFFRRPVKGE
jgi:hypothetical protein